MGHRKLLIGRQHKNHEKKQQALMQRPPGRPRKRTAITTRSGIATTLFSLLPPRLPLLNHLTSLFSPSSLPSRTPMSISSSLLPSLKTPLSPFSNKSLLSLPLLAYNFPDTPCTISSSVMPSEDLLSTPLTPLSVTSPMLTPLLPSMSPALPSQSLSSSVSLPMSSPCLPPQHLPLTFERIRKTKLPSLNWNVVSSTCNSHLYFYKLQDFASSSTSTSHPLKISHSLHINSNLTWKVSVYDHEISKEIPPLSSIPETLNENQVAMLLLQLDSLNVCSGHPEPHFIELLKDRMGKLFHASGEVAAYVDTSCSMYDHDGYLISETIRTSNCTILTEKGRCINCTDYRPTLRSIYNRWQKRQAVTSTPIVNISSHTNDRWLKPTEQKEKLTLIEKKLHATEKKNGYLQQKIRESFDTKSINVDDNLHTGLSKIIQDHSKEIEDKYKPNSFHHLFWSEQVKNLTRLPTQRRWHPMFIRWCLHLKMLSGTAYDTLRKTLVLPCGRTLQDYTHFIKEGTGIQPEVTKQLLSAMKFDKLEDHQKYVSVVFDEMKIKEGLVYDKHECKVIGFVDVGTINNTLLAYERTLKDDQQSKPVVAKHMLVFMVRGLFVSNIQFPYAQYSTTDLSADILFPLVWDVVRHLETAGLKVISLTGDKGSCNPKFFRMHHKTTKTAGSDSDVVYKVKNPFSCEERDIYFISDVPHLIKTVRNAWSNSFGHNQARALWLNGQYISWEHLKRVYNKQRFKSGFKLSKLTHEHIYLNSYSRMRVNLAAQVLSNTVASAFAYYGDDDTKETERFVRTFDRFFDMMNTRCLEEGMQNIKPDLDPYREKNDDRFEWLEKDFLNYLKEWETSVEQRSDHEFTAAQKNMMLLSLETREGLQITVKSFVEMAKFLLSQPGVDFILSERFCQDCLEVFFGKQRAQGGRSDNPTSQQFLKNTVSIRVQATIATDPARGNNRKRPTTQIEIDETPLPRRKHTKPQ